MCGLVCMDYNKITIDTYNKIAKEYTEKVKGMVPMDEFKKFINYVPFGNILDIGCGSGVATRNLQEKGLQVYGIDLSDELINIAREESPNSKFRKMDMLKMSFPHEMFDGIWHVASLLHLEKKYVPIALFEANRALKPEGIMYLSIKEGESEGLEKDERCGGLPKYYSYYQEDEITDFLEKANFELVEPIYAVRYKDDYRIKHPWFNIFARKK